MWRASFYEKSPLARWFYKPAAAALWFAILAGVAYDHATQGLLRPWALAFIALGFTLFLLAKLQMFRRRRWVSFGSDHAREAPWRIGLPYYAGYGFMISGFVLSFG